MMTETDMQRVIDGFAAAAKRAVVAGCAPRRNPGSFRADKVELSQSIS
jgi:hypothetical protein